MRSDSESDTDSESRLQKRQRLSSPTYDDQFEMYSQDEVNAFDMFERQLSQAPTSPSKVSQSLTHQVNNSSGFTVAPALKRKYTPDRDTRATTAQASASHFLSVASLACSPSQSADPRRAAKQLSDDSSDTLPSSPDIQQGQDISTWFQSTDMPQGGLMFQSAKDLAMAPSENDGYHEEGDGWFSAPPPTGAVLIFQPAKGLKDTFGVEGDDRVVGNASGHPGTIELGRPEATPQFAGFQTGASLLDSSKSAKKNSWPAPSATALAKAAERMKRWEAEIDQELAEPSAQEDKPPTQEPQAVPHQPSFGRAVLRDVENSAQPSSSQPEVPVTPTPVRTEFRRPSSAFASPLGNKKPFKSPLLTKPVAGPSSTPSHSSPLNPKRSTSSTGFKPPSFTTPLKAAFSSVSASPSSSFVSPTKKSLGLTPRRLGTNSPLKKPAFTTPFKAGMKPGEPGRAQLDASQKMSASTPIFVGAISQVFGTPAKKDKGKGRATFFDLIPPQDRQTLASSGLRPQSYSREELESYGVNAEVLFQMKPDTAQWYRFYLPAPTSEQSAPMSPVQDTPPQPLVLGPERAFQELKDRGCRLATLPWVENHWGLILWKLAGMVALEPHRETDPKTRRWCWDEVIRQLLYRYERELNCGTRPPLRLIAAQDKPAGLPMVLCISAISWPDAPAVDSEDTSRADAQDGKPEVEMTDGWYRVRVEVDGAMVRAIRRGALRAGMKVGVVGAKLFDRRAEPFELLECPLTGVGQDSTFALTVSGNGCHLAPWHAKLGFQGEPFVATLGSLTADGGLVPVMDLKIVKTFPIAHIEFFDTPESKSWSAPMKEPEEAKAQDAWLAKRDATAQRAREKMDKLFREWEKQAERLEIRAGSEFKPRPDGTPPETIDDLLCAMEDALATPQPYECPQDIVSRTSRAEAGWLAQAMREKLANDRANMADEIEKEMQTECPPRKVRSFRVVVVEDAETRRRPKQFRAQVTIWDVLTAYVSEDGIPGDFRVGERFTVTNLEPNNPSAWMPRGDEAEIYLIARRDTRWRKVRSRRIQ